MEALVALLCLRLAAWRPLLLLGLGVLSVVPWVWAAMGHRIAEGETPLDLISWMYVPGGADLVFQIAAPFGDGPLRARWIAAITLGSIVAGGALLLRHGRLDASRLLILLGALGVPATVFLVARVLDQPVFAPRQLIGASFCLLVLLAMCLSTLPRVAGAAALAVLLACSLLALPDMFPSTRNPDWPAIAAFLDGERGGEPVRSAEPWITDPLSFYRHGGPVYGRTSMTAGMQGESRLLLCRPQRCDLQQFGGDVTAIRSWRWGKKSMNELRLYERAVADRRN
jgi:hypothetical protein